MAPFVPPGISAAQTPVGKGYSDKGKGSGRAKRMWGQPKGPNFGHTLTQLQHPSQGLQGLQSLVQTLTCLSGMGFGELGAMGKSGGKGNGGKRGKGPSSSAWENPNAPQGPLFQQERNQPAIKDEVGAPATMLNNQGVEVPVSWICSQVGCHYPHFGHRQFCSNCKVPRNKAKEPTVLISSQIKPRVAPAPLLAAAPKAKPAPLLQPGQPAAAVDVASGSAPEQSAEAQASQEGIPVAQEATPTLQIPACLSAATVKLLIKEGIEVGLKYKETFKVKTLGQSEMQEQLATQQRRLSFMETAPPGDFTGEIEVCSAFIKSLEEKLGTATNDDPMSELPAPGEESGLVSKLTNLLSRHQVNMAAEESNYKETITDMEAQIIKLKAGLAQETATAQARNAANEELLAALQAKILTLTNTHPHVAAAQQLQEESKFEAAIKQRFQPSWLQQNGLGGITQEAVSAMCTQLMLVLHETRMASAASSSDGSGSGPMDWMHHASKRNWASQSEDAEDEDKML